MGTKDFPDMCARSPRAEGIHIRQITSAHVTTNMYHFCALIMCGRVLSCSSPNAHSPDVLLYSNFQRFDCGLRFTKS